MPNAISSQTHGDRLLKKCDRILYRVFVLVYVSVMCSIPFDSACTILARAHGTISNNSKCNTVENNEKQMKLKMEINFILIFSAISSVLQLTKFINIYPVYFARDIILLYDTLLYDYYLL